MRQQPECEPFTVTILYQDLLAAAEAVAACRRALAGAGIDPDFSARPWRLDILDWPEMQTQLKRDIAESDVIVFCAGDDPADCEKALRFAQRWPTAHGGERRAVAPFCRNPCRCGLLAAWFRGSLREIAAGKGMEFLSDIWPGVDVERPEAGQREEPHPAVPAPAFDSGASLESMFTTASIRKTLPVRSLLGRGDLQFEQPASEALPAGHNRK